MKANRGDRGLSSVVADIGATNIRFARLTAGGHPGTMVKFATAKFPGFEGALEHFLKLEGGPKPDRIALALAGPVCGDETGRYLVMKFDLSQYRSSTQNSE